MCTLPPCSRRDWNILSISALTFGVNKCCSIASIVLTELVDRMSVLTVALRTNIVGKMEKMRKMNTLIDIRRRRCHHHLFAAAIIIDDFMSEFEYTFYHIPSNSSATS